MWTTLPKSEVDSIKKILTMCGCLRGKSKLNTEQYWLKRISESRRRGLNILTLSSTHQFNNQNDVNIEHEQRNVTYGTGYHKGISGISTRR